MLKLAQFLALEDTAPTHDAAFIEHCLHVAAKHPGLTITQLVEGCGMPTGYMGWFYTGGRPIPHGCLERICAGMKCSPSTLLIDVLQQEVTV